MSLSPESPFPSIRPPSISISPLPRLQSSTSISPHSDSPLSHIPWDVTKYCYLPDMICISQFDPRPEPLLDLIQAYDEITDEHSFHRTFYQPILDSFLVPRKMSRQLHELAPELFHSLPIPTGVSDVKSRTIHIYDIDLRKLVEDYKKNWAELQCVIEVRRMADEKKSSGHRAGPSESRGQEQQAQGSSLRDIGVGQKKGKRKGKQREDASEGSARKSQTAVVGSRKGRLDSFFTGHPPTRSSSTFLPSSDQAVGLSRSRLS